MKITDLIQDDRNANRGTKRGNRAVAESLSKYGAGRSILIDRNGRIIAGNKTAANASAAGITDVEVIQTDGSRIVAVQRTDLDLDDPKARELAVADNRVAELGLEWNPDILGQLASETDLSAFFSDRELGEITGNTGVKPDEDDVPAIPESPTTVPGDLYLLGDHRLLCGDSTNVTDLDRLMDGDKADLVWTDPPYNVSYEGKTKDALTIKNDAMSDEQFVLFLRDVFVTLSTAVKPGGAVYVAHADTYGEQFRAAFREAGFHLASCLIWRKNTMVLGHSDHHWRHEPILYGWMPGASHFWDGGRKQTTVVDESGPLVVQREDGSLQITGEDEVWVVSGSGLKVETLTGTVITVDKPSRSADHPTTKPVALIERQILNSSRPGEIVLDVFGGSGSTLIACEKTGRKARLMELDPKYCDVIVRRYEEQSGKKAVLCDRP